MKQNERTELLRRWREYHGPVSACCWVEIVGKKCALCKKVATSEPPPEPSPAVMAAFQWGIEYARRTKKIRK